jgi:hypothetical protein
MNREDIIRMAREAGLHIATDVNWMPIISFEYAEKFAALVASAEREKFCATLKQLHDSYSLASDSNAIRERGKHD